ncbi:pap2 family carboxy-terminal protein [Cystoisospora suis]|uniref:Pap2 family carboxy-terminal protein n=1 Tax=Cystoisospora suis TaxID=483139 RepID=A0A2C6LEP3_9APIC|nr:pap2 family carboxy-terminal protein [Cystoisospora suis]
MNELVLPGTGAFASPKKGTAASGSSGKEGPTSMPALWVAPHSLRFYICRFVTFGLYFVFCIYTMCLCSVMSDSFFDPKTQKSLPDRIHDQLLNSRPLSFATPFIVDVVTVGLLVVTIFRHMLFIKMPLNLAIGVRFLFLLGCLYLLRGLAIVITTLPPSTRHCVPMPVTSVSSFFYQGFLQAISKRSECTGMIISGHSTMTCCCLALWLLYGNANREDRDTENVPFYMILRFILSLLRRMSNVLRRKGASSSSSSSRRRQLQYAGLKSDCSSDLEGTGSLGEGTGVAVGEEECEEVENEDQVYDRRKTLWGTILRLNILRNTCLVVGLVNLWLIIVSFNHYTIDVFMAINFTFGAWCIYHCLFSLIWAEKERESSRQKIALLHAEEAPAVDDDSISEASTSATTESGVTTLSAAGEKKVLNTEAAGLVAKGEAALSGSSHTNDHSNTSGFSLMRFPIIRAGARVIRFIEGL